MADKNFEVRKGLTVGNTIIVTSGANVGIGNTTPAYTLHVEGDIYTSGTLRLSTIVTQNTTGLFVGANFSVNSTTVNISNAGLRANGSVGSAGQTLTSNGSVPYWASPVGSNTQLIFNDSGAYNATAGIVFNKTTNTFTVSNTINVVNLTVSNSGSISTNVFSIGTGAYFVSTGHLGLGNSAPATQLKLYKDTTDSYQFEIEQDGAGDSAMHFLLSGVTETTIGLDNSDSDKFKISRSGALGNTDQLTIDSSGHLGIGNSAPVHKLSVNGTSYLQGNVVVISGFSANGSYGSNGQVLTSNGTIPYWGTLSVEGLKSTQVFTSSGTWTKPAGVSKILVFCTGGGGGGYNNPSNISVGGGAGGTSIKFIDASALTSETVTIGAGGALDSDGGTSSFGSHCSASGGYGADHSSNSGIGGTATGGDLNIQGGCSMGFGETCSLGGSSFWGGGGGLGYSFTQANGAAYGSGGSGNWPSNNAGVGKSGVIYVLEF